MPPPQWPAYTDLWPCSNRAVPVISPDDGWAKILSGTKDGREWLQEGIGRGICLGRAITWMADCRLSQNVTWTCRHIGDPGREVAARDVHSRYHSSLIEAVVRRALPGVTPAAPVIPKDAKKWGGINPELPPDAISEVGCAFATRELAIMRRLHDDTFALGPAGDGGMGAAYARLSAQVREGDRTRHLYCLVLIPGHALAFQGTLSGHGYFLDPEFGLVRCARFDTMVLELGRYLREWLAQADAPDHEGDGGDSDDDDGPPGGGDGDGDEAPATVRIVCFTER
jgi:hypothetical protein